MTRTSSRPRTDRPKVTLKLKLHPGQREVHKSRARFKVVACGRQWGKSKYASAWAIERALKGKKGWWVAPDANVARIGWELLKGLARQVPDVEIMESVRIILFGSGGSIQVKGAHNEGKLRGVTLDFLVVDEAAFIPSGERWSSELRPTLAVKKGEALFVSTFNGENWYYDLYQLGQDDNEPEWESWRKPSTENPWFSSEELEAARKTTPRAEFEQEYLANPLVYVGAVFDGLQLERARERFPAGVPADAKTYAGLDWGYTNPTALEVCREDSAGGTIEWFDERLWHSVELNKRCVDIAAICAKQNVRVIFADAAGKTENVTLAATLKEMGVQAAVKPVSFAKFKAVGIAVRRWYLEHGLESLGTPQLSADSKRYRYLEGKEEVEKEDDHTVDASTAFYSARRHVLVSAAGTDAIKPKAPASQAPIGIPMSRVDVLARG